MKKQVIITYFLISLIALLPASDLFASKRSEARKSKRKQAALKILKENSTEISQLAGLEPDSIQEILENTNTEVINPELETALVGDEGEDISELELDDDIIVDMDDFDTLWLTFVSDEEEDEFTETGINKAEMMDEIMGWLGTPYRFGSDSRKRIDCSAFIRKVYRNIAKVEFPRVSYYQSLIGEKIPNEELQFGDLVFFKTRNYRPITHVGIYLGDNLFVHASSRNGVTISSLKSNYYSRKFKHGTRLRAFELSKLEKDYTQMFGDKQN